MEVVDSIGKIRKDGQQMILAFGRHKGRDVQEVYNEDPRYIKWLLSPKGIEDENGRGKVRDYLGINDY